jgi:glycosyltransferase involved in cell wall biosynthesis
MNSYPLVSVVIPMYNVENYIAETLESVLNQTYKNLEIVIVDDGSKDNSASVVKEYLQKHNCIKYIIQENSGVSIARNRGVAEATGEFIAFLDSDDLWLPEKLGKQLERIQASSMDACYCGYKEYIDGRIGSSFPERYYEGDILVDVLEEKTSTWTSTLVIRKSIITKNDLVFEKGCNWAEDMEFFAKVMCFTKVCCVKEYLALYRKRENSLSFSPSRINEISIWERYKGWLASCDDPMHYDKKTIINAIDKYRIPGVVIFCLYETYASNRDMIKGFNIKELSEYMSQFRPNTSGTAVKLLVKKLLLKYKYKICAR